MLWETVSGPEDAPGSEERRASKVVKLHSGPIHYMVTVGQYLVSGGADGHVRFFDFNFRVVAWFEDLDAGPISSISFAYQPSALKATGVDLACPDFILGTTNVSRRRPRHPRCRTEWAAAVPAREDHSTRVSQR